MIVLAPAEVSIYWLVSVTKFQNGSFFFFFRRNNFNTTFFSNIYYLQQMTAVPPQQEVERSQSWGKVVPYLVAFRGPQKAYSVIPSGRR